VTFITPVLVEGPAPQGLDLHHLTAYRLRLLLKDFPTEDHLHIGNLVHTVQGLFVPSLPHGGLDADHIILTLVFHHQVGPHH
jgi:hypothetical protein